MQLWNNLVSGLLKQGLNRDYDRLTELVNKHADVRRFLGLNATLDEQVFSYRTVNRNPKLLTPDLLAEINGNYISECRRNQFGKLSSHNKISYFFRFSVDILWFFLVE